MVPDLQHVDRGQLAALLGGLKDPGFRIAGQQRGLGRIAGNDHHARLVGGGVLHRPGRGDDVEFDGAHMQPVAIDQLLHVARRVALGVADHRDAGFERPRREEDDRDAHDRGDRRQAPVVIGVQMRDHDARQRADTQAGERRQNVGGIRTGVDEQSVAAVANQDRVTLPDIHDRDRRATGNR